MKKRGEFVIIQHHIRGLKCDTAGCDYHDDARFEDYIMHLNRPCPKCGGNLLTLADLNSSIELSERIKRVNAWCNRWLPMWLLRRWDVTPEREAEAAKYHVHMNGTGERRVEVEKRS